jgi:hypothetical protein
MLGTQQGNYVTLTDVTSAFHIYSMEWTPLKIDFFCDGVKYFTFYKYADDYKKWPFNKRFHLIMNIAVGGSWGGAQGVDIYVFPARMEVAYVRVYQLSTSVGEVSFERFITNPQYTGSDFEIIPNPFNDKVMINYSGSIDQIDIYNCIGQKSMNYQNFLTNNFLTDNSALILNLDNLKPGIYFLGLKYQDETMAVRKAVKY